jgi:hypothetical protein
MGLYEDLQTLIKAMEPPWAKLRGRYTLVLDEHVPHGGALVTSSLFIIHPDDWLQVRAAVAQPPKDWAVPIPWTPPSDDELMALIAHETEHKPPVRWAGLNLDVN